MLSVKFLRQQHLLRISFFTSHLNIYNNVRMFWAQIIAEEDSDRFFETGLKVKLSSINDK